MEKDKKESGKTGLLRMGREWKARENGYGGCREIVRTGIPFSFWT